MPDHENTARQKSARIISHGVQACIED